jgi:hypothetical protein
MPGLFGDLDANEVSDNPFYVAPDIYQCTLIELNRVEKKDQSGEGLSFKWQIEDSESEYEGSTISEWINIYPDAVSTELTQNMRRDNARLKQRLTQMGLSAEEMNVLLDEDNLDKIVGLVAFVDVIEQKDKNYDENGKIYTNVRKVILPEDATELGTGGDGEEPPFN